MFGVIPSFLLQTDEDPRVAAIPDGPHNIGWTFPDEVNAALWDFLKG